MIYDNSDFLIRLRTLLEKRKISQARLAEKIGISSKVMSDRLTGKARFSLEEITTLAEYLGCDCHFLLTGRRAQYARIADSLGLSDEAISTLANVKDNTSDYLPALYSAEIREKISQAHPSMNTETIYEGNLIFSISRALSIALSNQTFISALVDYLSYPDTNLDVIGWTTYVPDDFITGVSAFGTAVCADRIETTIEAQYVLERRLLNQLYKVRTDTQNAIEKWLSENGYRRDENSPDKFEVIDEQED